MHTHTMKAGESSSLYNGAVTYLRIKATDAKRTEKMKKKCLSGNGSCRGSRKERMCAEQVTDKERSTNVRVTDV